MKTNDYFFERQHSSWLNSSVNKMKVSKLRKKIIRTMMKFEWKKNKNKMSTERTHKYSAKTQLNTVKES